MRKGKVLIAAPIHEILREGLEQAGYSCVFKEDIQQEQAAVYLRDCSGLITSTRLKVDRALIDASPTLQWIGRMGSGMEIIDVAYATEKGIKCISSPEGNANAVAEHALGMLLSLTKKITQSHQQVSEGLWLREENRGIELEGKTIGIIGYGHTGQAFVRKLKCMDMRVLVYDKYVKPAPADGIEVCEEVTILQQEADIVSFHVPLQEDTKHYFDSKWLANINKPLIVINTSRGEVVDIKILYEGLKTGKIFGVCLDVIEGEPLSKMSEIQKNILHKMMEMSDRVVITPHIAGYSKEALYKMSKVLLDRIVKF
jgi:D-3-phosphoglycerate dehydrogenase